MVSNGRDYYIKYNKGGLLKNISSTNYNCESRSLHFREPKITKYIFLI